QDERLGEAILSKVDRCVRDWAQRLTKQVNESVAIPDAAQRLTNLLNSVFSRSAREKLKSLASRGVVADNAAEVWASVRHPRAHGADASSKSLQAQLDSIDAVRNLFNEIVFFEISYSGAYRDFGTDGWRIRRYPRT
ncbi:MAG TPA: hypothetical protein VNV25_22415, partial [Gemmatimonadaceae bacterium]|nr:hypothetical protein [Gemmatimonadaceae bacterium]